MSEESRPERGDGLRVTVCDDEAVLARRAAGVIADVVSRAVEQRGRASVAFSGGSTPARMLAELVGRRLPWKRVHVFQVDERLVPAGHPDRNLRLLRRALLDRVPVPEQNVHPAPVDRADPAAGAARYAQELMRVCGEQPVLDLVHLGLGADGHTASLLPGDPALGVLGRPVAVTGEYAGHRRITLTAPVLSRARERLWLVTGADKAEAVQRLVDGGQDIPAGRIAAEGSSLFLDAAAAVHIGSALRAGDE